MQSKKEGCLVVFLLKGDFEHDLDVFNKMDPYIIFKLNDQKARSLVKDEAGKTPEWNETFSFRCKEGDILFFTVYDKDPNKDDEVGSGQVNVHNEFVDNRCSYCYPVTLKGKSAGTVAMQLVFLPDDTKTVQLVQSLQKELQDKLDMVKEIKSDIEENQKNPPKPKPESLLMKNLLDIFEMKKQRDTQFIEESIAKVEAPYLEKIKELNMKLEDLILENEQVKVKNGESLNEVNNASYELSLYKSLSERGTIKIKVLDIEIIKDKKYDAYLVLYIDRQNYKTQVLKVKKSGCFNATFDAKRTNDDYIIVNLLDKSSIGSDDLLGVGAIDLMPIITEKVSNVVNVELSVGEELRGNVKIELLFVKD